MLETIIVLIISCTCVAIVEYSNRKKEIELYERFCKTADKTIDLCLKIDTLKGGRINVHRIDKQNN